MNSSIWFKIPTSELPTGPEHIFSNRIRLSSFPSLNQGLRTQSETQGYGIYMSPGLRTQSDTQGYTLKPKTQG